MPKLYFYDTGLACSLLGIQKKEQLDFHFITGFLFENFIISEVIKSRFNNALNSNLFFWRDNTGHEIDLLIENPGSLYPVEIKYGQTITQEFFKGLFFWQKISDSLPGTVVYGGEEYQQRSNGLNVLPWRRSGEL